MFLLIASSLGAHVCGTLKYTPELVKTPDGGTYLEGIVSGFFSSLSAPHSCRLPSMQQPGRQVPPRAALEYKGMRKMLIGKPVVRSSQGYWRGLNDKVTKEDNRMHGRFRNHLCYIPQPVVLPLFYLSFLLFSFISRKQRKWMVEISCYRSKSKACSEIIDNVNRTFILPFSIVLCSYK